MMIFGGHAKRNEFQLGGKLQLLNGGTMLIDSPTAYSAEAAGLMQKLGIDPVALNRKMQRSRPVPLAGDSETGVFFRQGNLWSGWAGRGTGCRRRRELRRCRNIFQAGGLF